MTLKEFLGAIYIPEDERVAVFCERTWEGSPEFTCTIGELKTYSDLMDKEIRGLCSGKEYAMSCLSYEELDNGVNLFEIALDWDGDEW